MHELNFLENTGIIFHSLDQRTQFGTQSGTLFESDLLDTPREYYIFVELPGEKGGEARGFLKTSKPPIGPNQKLIGPFAITPRQAIDACSGRWMPLFFGRKTADGGRAPRGNDWVRLWVGQSPFSDPEQPIYHLVLAVDTTTHDTPQGQHNPADCYGFFREDIGLNFEPLVEHPVLQQSRPLLNWLQNLFGQTPFDGPENIAPHFLSLAAYFTLIETFLKADLLPRLKIIKPEGTPIDVHLVLDLGNSRACGLLAESEPGKSVVLDDCQKLLIRNLQKPWQVYTEPFDTSFKFAVTPFENPHNPHDRRNFRWPSITRLGEEAAEMEMNGAGRSGLSSPKRYLWSEKPENFPWYFNLPGEPGGRQVEAPFLQYLDELGNFKEKALIPFEKRFPMSSMMTFLILEILAHAHAQINSLHYRREIKGRGNSLQNLKSLSITTPCGMGDPEKEIYRQRVNGAVEIFHRVTNIKTPRPEIHMDFDEATTVQLTYLLGEIKGRFFGDVAMMIDTLGRPHGEAVDPSFRLAAIDIGGGTTDMMIAEYRASGLNRNLLEQSMLFREGVSIAGDEIAKKIIERVVLKRIFEAAKNLDPKLSAEPFKLLFGPSRAERTNEFIELKKAFCREVLIPIAHFHLRYLEEESAEEGTEVKFHEFFPGRRPGDRVKEFFTFHMRRECGVELKLDDVPWRLSRREIDGVIENCISNMLVVFSDLIAQFDCDAIVLGGRPSSLPLVRRLLVRYMAVPPANIQCLKGFPVGGWYPFAQRGGGIVDPKTACVVGAAIWLFGETRKNLEGFSLKTDKNQTAGQKCFLGILNPESRRQISPLLPGKDGTMTIEINRNTLIGSRYCDAEILEMNPLYELEPNLQHHPDQNSLRVTLIRDPHCPERLSLKRVAGEPPTEDDPCRLGLRTLIDSHYWLDTGCFNLFFN